MIVPALSQRMIPTFTRPNCMASGGFDNHRPCPEFLHTILIVTGTPAVAVSDGGVWIDADSDDG